MRLVIDLIRGRNVEEALTILHFSPKHAARAAEKVLRSAISNFQSKDEAGRIDLNQLYVKEAFVDGGPMLKRISPAPQGRAYRIRKRSNHVTIVIAQKAERRVPEIRKPAPAKDREPVQSAAAEEKPKVKKPAAKRTAKHSKTSKSKTSKAAKSED
jgi:large subunit ribosomal protein L22